MSERERAARRGANESPEDQFERGTRYAHDAQRATLEAVALCMGWDDLRDEIRADRYPMDRLVSHLRSVLGGKTTGKPDEPGAEFFGRLEREFTPGSARILLERRRQIEVEEFDACHDEEHANGELIDAARCYAVDPDMKEANTIPPGWPWHSDTWKPRDQIFDLVRAGALIAAEIDRLLAREEP